eukprot:403357861
MDKLNKVISSFKNIDLGSLANDKVVVCLAFIGLAASTKYVAQTIIEQRQKPKTQRPNQLKMLYGGEWALIMDISEENGKSLAVTLAKEGYNILVFGRSSDNLLLQYLDLLSEKYQVKTRVEEFNIKQLRDLKNTMEFENLVFALELDISIIVNNLAMCHDSLENSLDSSQEQSGQDQELKNIMELVNSNVRFQMFLFKVLQPLLARRFDLTHKKGAVINIQTHNKMQDKNPYASAYAANKAFEYSYSMGITEEQELSMANKVDILSAVSKQRNIVIQREGETQELIKQISDDSRLQQSQEEQDKYLQMAMREYEFVPQMLYNQQRQNSHTGSIGTWPFTRNVQSLNNQK